MPGIRRSTVAGIQSLQCLNWSQFKQFCLNCVSVVQTTWTKIVLKIASPGLKISPKCVCGRGSAPDPTGGAYSAPPDPLAAFRGAASQRRREWRKGGERKGRRGEGEGVWPPSSFMLIPTLSKLNGQRLCLLMSDINVILAFTGNKTLNVERCRAVLLRLTAGHTDCSQKTKLHGTRSPCNGNVSNSFLAYKPRWDVMYQKKFCFH